MSSQGSSQTYTSDFTSIVEGQNLSAMIKVWSDIAVSEVKMMMMKELRTLNVGFNEVEEFNLGLIYNCKSQKMKDSRNNPSKKVIKAAMEIKLNDERMFNKELCSERNRWRKKMATTPNHTGGS